MSAAAPAGSSKHLWKYLFEVDVSEFLEWVPLNSRNCYCTTFRGGKGLPKGSEKGLQSGAEAFALQKGVQKRLQKLFDAAICEPSVSHV